MPADHVTDRTVAVPVQQRWGYGLPDQAPFIRPESAPPPATHPWLRHLRGDLIGGFTSAAITIPIAIGYGILALSALGGDYIAHGVLAGLYGMIFGCITAVLIGANTTMVYSPRSIVTYLIASLVTFSFVRSSDPVMQTLSADRLLVLIFLMMAMAGLLQMAFGALRFGGLVKYVPAPVMAGFQNAAAILILFAQFDQMLGFGHHVSLLALPAHLPQIQPLTLAVGVLTCFFAMRGARFTKRVPPTMLGLLAGVTGYYLCILLGAGDAVGPIVGTVPLAIPTPHYATEFFAFLQTPEFQDVLPILVSSAVSLAIVASFDGLLCARLIESDSGNKIRGSAELIRLGAGNVVAACFGGISNGINLASSFANHRSGGRTPLSVLVAAGTILVGVLILPPVIERIPRVVIAGLLVVVAIQLFDRWTLQLIRRLFREGPAAIRPMAIDLMVILVVTALGVGVNVVVAVLAGVAITMLFFLFRMSRSVVRRTYRCDAVHSRKTRDPRLMEVLQEHGGEILVLELEGPLFFGTAENLAIFMDDVLKQPVNYVVFDLKRVNDLDSTGAKVLLQTHERLTRLGRHLLISGIEERGDTGKFLRDMGVTAAITTRKLFADIDRAIEWAEDHVILAHLGGIDAEHEFPFASLDAFAGMADAEVELVKGMLTRHSFKRGEVVVREGDESRELFIIAKGTASVHLRLPGAFRATRLITFSPGTIFGEMALLDQETRSATIEADEFLVCYVLPQAAFEVLKRTHPDIAIKLLANLARELASRLRRANRTIYQLAS
jgi:MFS superfamily sulfate permease-like transporter